MPGGSKLNPIAPEGAIGVITEQTFGEAYSGFSAEDLPERFLQVVKTLGPWLVDNAPEVEFPHHTAVRTAWYHLPGHADITCSLEFRAVQYAYFMTQQKPVLLPMLLESSPIFTDN